MSGPNHKSKAPGVLRSTGVVGGFTLISRVLGLVRDIVIANVFGVSRATEAFFVANKIPNMLRRFFAEGAFSQAFVPVANEYREKHGEDPTRELVAGVAGTLGGFLFVLTLIGVVAAPILVYVFAPGFAGDDRFDLTAEMLRFTFPYLLFISLTAMAGGLLNSYGNFSVPALTPVFLNLVLITAALWLAPALDEPGMALAVGVFVAGLVQLAFQLPFLKRIGMLSLPRWRPAHAGVKKIGTLMLPALFGSSVAQINIMIDNIIASHLATGSVSWLYYSDRLMEFPLGVFGIALATVILPRLSSQHARADSQAFSDTIDYALRLVCLIGIPAAVGLAVLSGPLIVTLFFRGQFSLVDAQMAQLSLIAFSAGLLGFMLVKILAPGYFARQDTKTPVRIALVALAVNLVLNLSFVLVFKWAGWSGSHAGLALATSIAALVNAALLFAGLTRAGVLHLSSAWVWLLLRLAIACVLMAAMLWFASPSLEAWTAFGNWERVLRLGGLVVAGGALYSLLLLLMGLRPSMFLAPQQSVRGSR